MKRTKKLTVTTTEQNGEPVPFIRLRGKWLQRLGLTAGCTLAVNVSSCGQITLTPTVASV